jgi:hypothetical protein
MKAVCSFETSVGSTEYDIIIQEDSTVENREVKLENILK